MCIQSSYTTVYHHTLDKSSSPTKLHRHIKQFNKFKLVQQKNNKNIKIPIYYFANLVYNNMDNGNLYLIVYK